jgi:hypothetical protein
MANLGRIATDDQERLRAGILSHVCKGAREHALVEFLFARLSRNETRVLTAGDVMAACPEGPDSKTGVGSLKHRLNAKLRVFFDDHVEFPARVTIAEGYHLVFEENKSDLVERFWRPYLGSEQPVRMFYPEPQFFKDDHDTYLRNPTATKPEDGGAFEYLWHSDAAKLKPVYSFVPAGVVRAMMLLIECLQHYDVRFMSSVVRPMNIDDSGQEDLIILGTPSTNHLIATLERRMFAYADQKGIIVAPGTRSQRIYPDDNQEDLTGVKWALLTRRTRFGRNTTILSAKHGRTVQALAAFLTNHENLKVLADHLKCDGAFPKEFQVIFKVQMNETGTEPHIDDIGPERALLGPTNKKGPR